MKRAARPWTAYAPALSSHSPLATYAAMSSSDMDLKRTSERDSTESIQSSCLTATAVSTSCARPEKTRSIAAASSRLAGLPKMRPSTATVVSAASTGPGGRFRCSMRRQPAEALARARRTT